METGILKWKFRVLIRGLMRILTRSSTSATRSLFASPAVHILEDTVLPDVNNSRKDRCETSHFECHPTRDHFSIGRYR